jgi:FkbM family methyltransferase
MIRDEDLIVDLGANIGAFTVLVNALNPEASVLSVEPVPSNLKILLDNLDKNNVDPSCVEPIAVGDRDGRVTMSSDGGAASVTNWNGPEFREAKQRRRRPGSALEYKKSNPHANS